MSEPYRPIDCTIYSEYEQAILTRRWLRLSWTDAKGAMRREVLRPVDIFTAADKAEYLVAEDAEGHDYKLRLDWIEGFDSAPAPS